MRGQTAVEYLMTYGWAILIILIVAGVLAYYGIFAPSGFLGPSARGFASIYVISPWDFNSGGSLKIRVENRVGGEVNITNVYFNDPTVAVYDISPDVTVAAGTQSDFITATGGGTGNSGSTYSISVSVEYCLTSVGCTGGNLFNSTGTLTGTRS